MNSTTTIRANPYVGPRSFITGETLYGRDRETYKLLNLLIAERIVLLYSPSGAGKTSLIQAALVPQLLEEGFAVLPLIRVSAEPPTASAEFSVLSSELSASEQTSELKARDSDSSETTTQNSKLKTQNLEFNRYLLSTLLSLEEGLPAEQQLPLNQLAGMSLADYLARREAELADRDGVVLIFDQFEEVLTIDPTDLAAKHAFFQQLGEALRDRRRWALFAMREDYLAPLDPFVRPIPTRLGTTFRLDLLDEPAARMAMQRPAHLAGVQFTDAAAHALADDLRRVQVQRPDGTLEEQLGPYVEPVQLQVVCYRLWSQLPDDDLEIGVGDIAAVGDVDSALTAYYVERVGAIAAATGVRERAIRDWFDRQLITEQGIRGQVLQGAERSAGLENRAIWPLIDAHLVRGEKRRGATWFELAHDRLIEPIRVDNAAWREAHLSVLQRQAALWDQQSRPEGLLLRDAELAEAERWAAAHADVLTEVEREYLESCRNLREIILRARRANRRVRILAVVASVAFVIAVALAAFAIRAGRDATNAKQDAEEAALAARTAEAQAQTEKQNAVSAFGTAEAERGRADQQSQVAFVRQIAAQASDSRERRPQRSLLLALEAADPTRQPAQRLAVGEEALRDALAAAGGQPLVGPKGRLTTAAFSSDGKYLALGHADGAIELRNLATPAAPPLVLSGGQGVIGLAFSPDAKYVAVQSGDGIVRLWTTANPAAPPRQLPVSRTPFVDMAFSPDGRTLATGGDDGTLRLWNLADLSARPAVLRTGPTNAPAAPIFLVAYSPDGRQLAAAAEDGALRLWNLANPTAPAVALFAPQRPSPISALVFAPDGRELAAATLDGTLRVWMLTGANWVPAEPQRATGAFGALAYSPDGHRLDGVLYDGSVLIWEADDLAAAPYVIGGAEAALEVAVFSPDGQILAGAGRDGVARLWSTDNLLAPPAELRGHEAGLTALAFSPDGRRLVTGDSAGAARLWAVDQPQVAPRAFGGSADPLLAAALSPDGRLLAAGYAEGVMLWNVADPAQPPADLPGLDDAATVAALAFSPDGRSLVAGMQNGQLLLWSMAEPVATPSALSDGDTSVVSLAFSPDGRYLAVVDHDGAAQLQVVADPAAEPLILHEAAPASPEALQTATAVPPKPTSTAPPVIQTLTAISTREPTSTAPAVATPTGTEEATSEPDVNITEDVTEVETTTLEPEEPTDELPQETGTPAPTPQALAVKPARATGAFKLQEQVAPTSPPGPGEQPGTPPPRPAKPPTPTQPGTAARSILEPLVRFSPDGRYLAVASAGAIDIWTLADLAAPPSKLDVTTGAIEALAFSPDGRTLAVAATDSTLRLWATDQPQSPPMLLDQAARIEALAFSPDGRALIAGGQDAQLRLWNMSDLRVRPVSLRGHDSTITAAAFSPDGRYLVTAGQDQTMLLWDTAHLDGEAVALHGHTGTITTLEFSQDGRLLLARGDDQSAYIWQPRLDDLRELACASAGRNLTIAEWQLFIGSEPYRKTCPALPISDSLVESAADLIRQSAGYSEALTLVARVGALNAVAEIPPPSWDRLCWEGSLAGHAADLRDACEHAVAAAPDAGLFHDSRGLARALNGDLAGAAADFKAFVAWAPRHGIDEARIAKRREWIAALEGGRSPFDAATLQALRGEVNEHQRPDAAAQ